MPDEYRVTIRLSPDIYAQLEVRGSQGQPLAAIVREALVDYLSRQPEAPESTASLTETVAAIAARLGTVEQQLQTITTRLDAMAADRQPVAATVPAPAANRQPTAVDASSMAADRQPVAATSQQQRRSPAK